MFPLQLAVNGKFFFLRSCHYPELSIFQHYYLAPALLDFPRAVHHFSIIILNIKSNGTFIKPKRNS